MLICLLWNNGYFEGIVLARREGILFLSSLYLFVFPLPLLCGKAWSHPVFELFISFLLLKSPPLWLTWGLCGAAAMFVEIRKDVSEFGQIQFPTLSGSVRCTKALWCQFFSFFKSHTFEQQMAKSQSESPPFLSLSLCHWIFLTLSLSSCLSFPSVCLSCFCFIFFLLWLWFSAMKGTWPSIWFLEHLNRIFSCWPNRIEAIVPVT